MTDIVPGTVPAPAPAPLDHRGVLKVFSGLMIAMFLAAIDQTIVATAGPTIVGELGDLSSLPWIFSVYMLTSTATVPLYGKLSDLYGRRIMLQIAVVVFVVGSIWVGVAPNMFHLIAGRAVQGLGAGGLIPLSLAVIGDVLSPRARGRYMGYITSVFALASVTGPLVGGFFVDTLTWRWAFFVNVPLSALALVVLRRNLPPHRHGREAPVDYPGAALLTVALSSILVVTLFVEQDGFVAPTTIGCTTIGLGALVWLRSVERRAVEPVVPLELFADDVFNRTNVIGFLLGLSMFGILVFLPLFLQVSQGVSATESGLLLVPQMIAITISSLLAGRLVTRLGRYKIFVVFGTGAVFVAMIALTTLDVGSSPVALGAMVAALGLGVGTAMPILTTAVQNAVPERHLGSATSISQFVRTAGGIVGVSIFGTVLAGRATSSLDGVDLGADEVSELIADPERVAALSEPVRSLVREALADGVAEIIVIGTGLALLAFVVSFFLRDAELRDDLEAPPEEPVH